METISFLSYGGSIYAVASETIRFIEAKDDNKRIVIVFKDKDTPPIITDVSNQGSVEVLNQWIAAKRSK